MSAILRIALAYFSFVPIQRWINIAGAALMGTGLLCAVLMQHRPATAVGAISALGMLGMILVVLAPGFAGGVALRFASSHTMLNVRPYGRLRMMLGATLAITLVAMLMTLPVLASQLLVRHYSGRISPHYLPPAQLFQLAWSLTVALWIWTFFACGSRVLVLVIGFGPLVVSKLYDIMQPRFEPFLATVTLPGPAILFTAALMAWAAFAIWYARTHSIRLPRMTSGWARSGTPITYDYSSAIGFLKRTSGKPGSLSPAQAQRQFLLGTTSPVAPLTTGAILTFAVLLVRHFMDISDPTRQVPDFYLLVFTMVGAPLGLLMVARSRLLWLRAGLTRAGLFSLAEREGLATYSLTLGMGVIGFVAISLANRPDMAAAILIFTAAQIAFALCLFYLGMIHTRGWDAESVLLPIGLVLVYGLQAIATRPRGGMPPGIPAAALGLILLLAWLLRRRARGRWLALDWRVARLQA